MHYHCEIVVPPTADIEGAIKSVLAKFDENADEKDEDASTKYAFWDFWVIGGRWAGTKLMAKFDPAKIDEFEAWMQTEKITISGLQFGKQELQPASQIPKVDAKWNEMFGTNTPCPLFKHSNETLPDDVMRLGDVPERLKVSRVIFAGPSYESSTKEHTGPLEATFMLVEDAWNGCNHMKVDWDGTLKTAIERCRHNFRNYKAEYVERILPKNDWLAVTVDYHS